MSGLVIIGAGPAGISAAIEAGRQGIRVIVVEKGEIGGTISRARRVDNYPPSPPASGRSLASGFRKRLKDVCRRTVKGEAAEIVAGDTRTAPFRVVLRSGSVLDAGAVIVAVGQRDHIPPELQVFGDAISPPDGCLPGKGEKVAVYGGGDAAFDQAMLFRDNGAEVKLFCRGLPRAGRSLLDEAVSLGIEINRGHTLSSARKRERGVTVAFRNEKGRTLSVDCGRLVAALGKEVPGMKICGTDLREITRGLFPGSFEQPVDGIFLAGDVARGRDRYLAAAVADGIIAAKRAAELFRGGKNGPVGDR